MRFCVNTFNSLHLCEYLRMFWDMENCQDFLYESDTVEHREIRFLFCVLDFWKINVNICKENKIEFPNMDTIIWESTLREFNYFDDKSQCLPNLSEIIDLHRLHSNKKRNKNYEVYHGLQENREKVSFLQRNSSSC